MSTLTVTATVTDAGGHTGSATATCTISDTFVRGETEPTAANTALGVLGLTTADLTVINGDLNITPVWMSANGNTLDRVWIKGFVTFTGTVPFYLTNSIVSGRSFPTAGSPPRTALIYARSTSTPISAVINVINCQIYAFQPDVDIVGLSGERIGVVERNDISYVSDLINNWGSRPQVYSNYMHDFTFWDTDDKHANDGSHPFWSHNDGAQANMCINGEWIGNSVHMLAAPGAGAYSVLAASFPGGAWGSAFMLTGSTGYIQGAKIWKNWLYGGQAPICMPYQSSGAFEDGGCSWDVSGNRVCSLPDPYSTNQRQLIRWGCGKGPLPASVHDNVFGTGPEIPVALRGQPLPAAVLVGPATAAGGQYIVKVNA
jgi:hypothetical protein